jgi:hypothetical protein
MLAALQVGRSWKLRPVGVKAWRRCTFFLAVKKKVPKKNSRLRPLLWKVVSEVGTVVAEPANAEFLR